VGSRKRIKPRAGRGAIYTIPEDKRLKLDGSKNIIIHFFVERALVAVALLLPGSERTEAEVRARVQELSRLFKYEFRFRADASFDTIFADTVAGMIADGDLEWQDLEGHGQQLTPGKGRSGWTGHQWLMTYAGLLRNFVESYRVAARGLAGLEKGPLDTKELIKQTLATGRLMYLSGEVERAEAISKPLLENAFAAFQDLGYVNHAAGQMQLPSSPTGEDTNGRGRCLEESIAKYLDREVPA
jgi:glycerol-3-phosphate O-acyltransferase